MILAAKMRHIQSVIGTLLYSAFAIDITMLVAIGYIASAHSIDTANTIEAFNWLLYYSTSKPLAIIRYTDIGMVLYIRSIASFLSEYWSCSCAAGHLLSSDYPTNQNTPPLEIFPLNDLVYT